MQRLHFPDNFRIVVVFLLNVQPTAKVIWRLDIGLQGVPKKRSRYKKVYSFLNTKDITKIFYTVVVLL